MAYAIVQRVFQPAALGPLDLGPQQRPAPPVAAPPASAPGAAPSGQQNNPRYQPALQQPQPGMSGRPRAAEPTR